MQDRATILDSYTGQFFIQQEPPTTVLVTEGISHAYQFIYKGAVPEFVGNTINDLPCSMDYFRISFGLDGILKHIVVA